MLVSLKKAIRNPRTAYRFCVTKARENWNMMLSHFDKERLQDGKPEMSVVKTGTAAGPMLVYADNCVVSSALIRRGSWNENMTELFQDVVEPGDVAVDIGANVGYFSLLLSRMVEESGEVIAFEPADDNYRVVEENIRRFATHDNVRLEKYAVSDGSGSQKLNVESDHGQHSIISDSSSTQRVQTVSLDDYLQRDPDIVKIDAEGAEPLIIAGMTNVLNNTPDLVIEYSTSWESPRTTLERLRQHGYSMYHVESDYEMVSVDELMAKDDTHLNLFCTSSHFGPP